MNSAIRTVTGLVSPDEVGLIDGHNHVWISKQPALADDTPILDQPVEILDELKAFRDAGGWGQVDCQPGGAGRDGNWLRDFSAASGVKIIANTGFYLQQYYPEGAAVWSMGAEAAQSYFLSEITEGLEETQLDGEPVFPGFIKIAVQATLADSPRHLLEAAAAVSRETGYLVEMHTERGQDIENVLDFLGNAGLEPGRLVICHIDKRPDHGLHQELAQEGYGLEYDTFFRTKYQPEENLWPLIEEMVAGGFARNLVLATDLADKSLWAFGGGVGIEAFVSKVFERLDNTGFFPDDVQAMMGGNIAQRLAVPIKEE